MGSDKIPAPDVREAVQKLTLRVPLDIRKRIDGACRRLGLNGNPTVGAEKQLAYAANDVAYLHRLKAALDGMLAREGRTQLAQACFDFLPARAELDLAGWADTDIFAH